MVVNNSLKCRSAIEAKQMIIDKYGKTTLNQLAFIYGYSIGHVPSVTRVIKRINPGISGNNAIIVASRCNNYNVVRLLLKDPRVDPSDQNSQAFIDACEHGATETVAMLLEDQRVDPMAQNNQAYNLALKNGHRDIVELLIELIMPRDLN